VNNRIGIDHQAYVQKIDLRKLKNSGRVSSKFSTFDPQPVEMSDKVI